MLIKVDSISDILTYESLCDPDFQFDEEPAWTNPLNKKKIREIYKLLAENNEPDANYQIRIVIELTKLSKYSYLI